MSYGGFTLPTGFRFQPSDEELMSYGGFTLPTGFRFQPSDEELLSHYLEKKNQRKDSQITAIIPEIDVCKHEPRDLPALVFTRTEFLDRKWFTMADSPDMEWYFFSPRVYKHSNSKSKSKSTRIERTTKEGCWKKQGNDRRITGACSDKHIGGKRILTFYLSKKQKTDWVIHEYYLTDADSDEQIGDFVVCRLKDNRLKNKLGKSDREQHNAAFCGGGETSSVSCSMVSNLEDQASKGLANVLPITKDNDGSSCSMALHVENPASKELRGSRTDPCYKDSDHLLLCVEGQPDSFISPDSEMVEELLHDPLTSPQLQSPIYRKLGTTNCLNDECRKRKYPFGDSDHFLAKKNHTDEVDSNNSSYSENQAADAIPEGYPQSGENLGYDSRRSQELLSINREPRDFPHDNSFIEWDDLPSLIEGFDSSLPQSSHTLMQENIKVGVSNVCLTHSITDGDILLQMVQSSPSYMKCSAVLIEVQSQLFCISYTGGFGTS